MIAIGGADIATLSYDPLGRLYETVVNGVTTRFLYDGDALVAEYDGANALLRRYVHGSGVDQPLAWLEGAGSDDIRYYHANHQGSIIAISDDQARVDFYTSYSPYGVPSNLMPGRFTYTGQILLPGLDLYHYKARVYHPVLGRFLQTDPIGYQDQMNMYAYVYNDPVNATDPTGMQGCYCPSPGYAPIVVNAAKTGEDPSITMQKIGIVSAAGAATTGLLLAAPVVAPAVGSSATAQGVVAGALGGGAVAGVSQAATGKFDAKRLAVATVAGAATGGAASGASAFFSATPVAGGALGGLAGGSLTGAGAAAINGDDPATGAITGGLGGLAGGALAPAASVGLTRSSSFGASGTLTGLGAATSAASGEAAGAVASNAASALQQFSDERLGPK